MKQNIKEKVLKEKFQELQLKCIEETKKLGRASYITHGKRCEALGRFDEYRKTLKEVSKVIDEITYGCDVVLNETATCGDISFGNEILLCNKCRIYYDKIQNIKQKLGIK